MLYAFIIQKDIQFNDGHTGDLKLKFTYVPHT